MRAELERMLVNSGVDCPKASVDKLLEFYSLLTQWNEHTNLTSITLPLDYIYKHIYDSLYPARFFHSLNTMLVDVGTGAGFPGLPLKIVFPELQVTLVEASSKRVDFLRHCCNMLGIEVDILQGRAEDLGRGSQRERYNVATTRAVANLSVVCEYCLPLLCKGGLFLALKGPGGEREAEDARAALQLLGGEIRNLHKYCLPAGEERSLIAIQKISPTPTKYPRRPGIPAKRPL